MLHIKHLRDTKEIIDFVDSLVPLKSYPNCTFAKVGAIKELRDWSRGAQVPYDKTKPLSEQNSTDEFQVLSLWESKLLIDTVLRFKQTEQTDQTVSTKEL